MSSAASSLFKHVSFFSTKILESKITNPTTWDKALRWAEFLPDILGQSAKLFPGSMSAFDALVGENACHTRAARLIELIDDYQKDSVFQKELDCAQNIGDLVRQIPPFNPKPAPITFQQFLEAHNLNFSISPRAYYLAECFLLTKVKNQESIDGRIRQRTNPKALTLFSTAEAVSLVEMHQKLVAQDSCSFFYQEALHVKESMPSFITTSLEKKDKQDRAAIPSFMAMDVLMKRIMQKHTPIVLRISRLEQNQVLDQFDLRYMIQDSGKYEISDATAVKPQGQLVVQGFIHYPAGHSENKKEYLLRLSRYPLLDILLANAASLPQYSGYDPATPLPFEEWQAGIKDVTVTEKLMQYQTRYAALRDLSSDGFSYQKPGLFCIDHIYCEMMPELTEGKDA